MKSEIRGIPANLLSVDPKIQRPLDEKRVKDLAAGWNDQAVGILTVSDRGGQSLVVIDGQTRLAALRAVAGESTALELRADTFIGLMEHEEAQLFLQHNDRKSIKSMDRFRIALVAREPWAIEIQEILNNNGWRAVGTESDVPDTRQMTAITAAERIYKRDALTLANTVKLVTSAWGHDSGAASVHTIFGVGYLLLNHPDIDVTALLGKLRKMRAGEFIADVDMIRRTDRSSIAQSAYRNAVVIYNKSRSVKTRIEMK